MADMSTVHPRFKPGLVFYDNEYRYICKVILRETWSRVVFETSYGFDDSCKLTVQGYPPASLPDCTIILEAE